MGLFCYLCFAFFFVILSYMFPVAYCHLSERSDLLANLCVIFFCDVVTLPYGVLSLVYKNLS